MIKAVFVSDVNYIGGQVYGLRASSFAHAFARRGHQVVLLSPSHPHGDAPVSARHLPQVLKAHDWTEPLVATAPPWRAPVVEFARACRPAMLRKLMTGYLLAVEGGVHGDWERGARPIADVLANCFVPDVVWSVFGNSSTLIVGQRLARACGAAWFMDIKDNWELYMPVAVRALMRRRFADAAGFTSNAFLHGDIAARWLPQQRSIIYSGVASEMVAPPGRRADREAFRLTLVGSTYRFEVLRRFVRALSRWVQFLPEADRALVRLRYTGSAIDMVNRALAEAPLPCAVEATGNISHAELARLCQESAVNCYLWAPFTFHHKMLELLATRRPAISFPGEHDESLPARGRDRRRADCVPN